MWTKSITSRLNAFILEEDASITVEYVFMFPFLVWTFMASFAWFDAFKAKNTNLTASYTISDLLSRLIHEPGTDGIDMAYLNGMNDVFDYLTTSNSPTWIRVTSIKWDEIDDRYEVAWSKATKSNPVWTTDTIIEVKDRIPVMANGDYVILVETSVDYEPIFTYDPVFKVALEDITFNNFVISSMRFTPKLCFTGENCSV